MQISTANYVELGLVSRAIAGAEFEEVEGKKLLAIDDVYGGQINIIYQGQEIFLAVDRHQRSLKI